MGKTRCATCSKENAILKCQGCSLVFCYKHVEEHRQELNKQLLDVQMTCDLIRETFIEQTTAAENHPLIQQTNQWEQESIQQIHKIAEDVRCEILKHTVGSMDEIENRLNDLTNQIRKSREENDFFETDLCRLTKNLMELEEKLHIKPTNIQLRYQSTTFIPKISVDISGKFIE